MSRNACIRSCGRRRRIPSLLCSQCQGKERDRLHERRRLHRLNEKQKDFYGLPKKVRNVGYRE